MRTCYVHRRTTTFCQVLFFTAGLLYFKSNSCSFCERLLPQTYREQTCMSEPLVFFWHRHREGVRNKLTTETLSWLSFISDTLSHLAFLSRSLGNRWKEVPRFWIGLLSQLIMYVQAFLIVRDRTSTDSHSSHIAVNV